MRERRDDDTIAIRPARIADGAALSRIDAATWTPAVSPAPPPSPGTPFFDGRTAPGDVLVAEVSGAAAGYAVLGRGFPIAAHAHVLELAGLAVDPARGRRGIGRALVAAAVAEAGVRGARKLNLRVLGSNPDAQRLYAACGFEVEGLLRAEFLLAGRYVDDVLMTHHIRRSSEDVLPVRS